jgi:hypothetical protein
MKESAGSDRLVWKMKKVQAVTVLSGEWKKVQVMTILSWEWKKPLKKLLCFQTICRLNPELTNYWTDLLTKQPRSS